MMEAFPIYLGPEVPRWLPRTIGDVRAAIDDGLIAENHWIDVKELIGPSDGAKKEAARDLSSFAIHGGAIIVGIAEDKAAGTLIVKPLNLDGLPERLEEIVRTRCDPPLFIQCRPLPLDSVDQNSGVVLVEVPPSAAAPHMVDGRYYGRGDKTKRILTDIEVETLHATRRIHRVTGERLIQEEMSRDPVPTHLQQRGHVYVVAQPLATPPDWLTSAIERRELGPIVRTVLRHLPALASPPPNHANQEIPRAQGLGFSSHGLSGRRVADPNTREDVEPGIVDIEVADDGRISLFCGRATDDTHESTEQYIVDRLIVLYVRAAVELGAAIGTHFAYGNRWMVAVGVTRLGGRFPMSTLNTFGASMTSQPFSAEIYLETTETVTAEARRQPGSVTHRLLRRFIRGIGVLPVQYEPLLSDVDDEG